MDTTDELAQMLKPKNQGKPTAIWVVVKDVDWEEKTMTATSVVDDLDYFDVQLGLGSYYRRPMVGALAMIGISEAQDASTYLIDAEVIEQQYIQDSSGFKWHLNEGLLAINGDAFEGIVKAPELKKQIDKNTAILEAIQKAFLEWIPSPSDGGAALKVKVATIPAMQRADLKDIQNKKIVHGDG